MGRELVKSGEVHDVIAQTFSRLTNLMKFLVQMALL